MNNFGDVKNIFIEGDVFDYIGLNKSVFAYEKLVKSLQKPLKLVLFYGDPGSGKTFILKKIYQDLSPGQKIVFLPQPFFDEGSFLSTLHSEIFPEDEYIQISGYEKFLKLYKIKTSNSQDSKDVIVLLDEAQLYPVDLIEKIRLLSDTRLFKFLFTIHESKKENILAKDYFKTRIWESIKMPNSSLAEVENYLKKKFLLHNKIEFFSLFKPSRIKLIFKLTRGNLREINKLMYKLFEIYEYYELNQPLLMDKNPSKIKYLQMAAIDSGLIHA
ncbi:MAG: AAA family ATPase [Proteobacteria bacterium]|nr:MAG: AAA family ATPase [Pseudomonadota bacterium]